MIGFILAAIVAFVPTPADHLKDATAIREANLRVIHACPQGQRIGDFTDKYFSALGEYREATAAAYDEDINGLMRACAHSTSDVGLKATIALLIDNDLELVERKCSHLLPHEPVNADYAAYYGCQAQELGLVIKHLDAVRVGDANRQVRLLAEAMIHVDGENRDAMLKHRQENLPSKKGK